MKNNNINYKLVRAMSKQSFVNYCQQVGFNDNNIDDKNVAIIEILDSSYSHYNLPYYNGYNTAVFKNEHPNVLIQVFDDTEKESDSVKVIENDQAQYIFDFINNNIDKKKFIVHCSAGISRSGAVATFIYEYLKFLNYDVKFIDRNVVRPNQEVLRKLHNILNNY